MMSEKQTIVLMLDIWAGPIWGCTLDDDELHYSYYIPEICEDKELMALHQEIQDLFSSYYHFDYKDLPCWFDFEQQKKDKSKMLKLFARLKERIKELDDGTFIIDDRETELIEAL